jgi:antitoxin VapB
MTTLSNETEALAARLAAARHMSVDQAVRQALEIWARAVAPAETTAFRRRDVSPAAVARRKAAMDGIVAEIASLPVLDPRSAKEIMADLDSL